ncbi:MAG: hypothetical protein UV64_C0025G0012 [Parcubacteria group bacterium GW2011_GWC1_43_11b]|uniref:HNH nuclease domain-containing protein n=1 Tax=Candidatus Vogelbacteria bacterium RIFOXYB1_FULL_42_16 TaxID=1802436 RepID=A0A1G2QDT1_9BACT|nr:MAG: H-N-H endonuclease F-TflIV [Parcubacteria group bacterium GW2011_GWB1_42_9]KKS88304.1 MAG: hypothetical protein UV64_C0025G0012 [Parcubacteria group bacterium GW2011_GWC1_43_11b]KKT09211.1 MAG: H-N-H endonuclease F-TflIV [Parcubacteria group bacterium GW2011_GWA1_43_21]OHA58132.1 MAG: hypothetical protein A2370_02260 [Candidatus Vogelbacteria bacterium RIFOXYB1_FULL_42_16]
MKLRKWNDSQLEIAVKDSLSLRQVIYKLGLKPAGGNYVHVARIIKDLKIDSKHFKGMGWNKGLIGIGKPWIKMEDILKKDSDFQSYKLKKRLFKDKLKNEKCEECGWNKKSIDGRLPLELDHINGDKRDNRLSNLRILCPNCHSLKETHRGKNIRKA